jgi:hypothetical protein
LRPVSAVAPRPSAHAAALDAFDLRWSDEILDEVTRNVLADLPDIEEAGFVEHTIGAMRRASLRHP